MNGYPATDYAVVEDARIRLWAARTGHMVWPDGTIPKATREAWEQSFEPLMVTT